MSKRETEYFSEISVGDALSILDILGSRHDSVHTLPENCPTCFRNGPVETTPDELGQGFDTHQAALVRLRFYSGEGHHIDGCLIDMVIDRIRFA